MKKIVLGGNFGDILWKLLDYCRDAASITVASVLYVVRVIFYYDVL